MGNDSSPSRIPAWQRKSPGTEPGGPSRFKWKKPADVPIQGQPGSQRRHRLALVATLFFASIAALVCLIYWLWPPPPARLIVAGDNYALNLHIPHNVYGWNACRELYDWISAHNADRWWGQKLPAVPKDPPARLTSLEELQRLVDTTPKNSTLILYLALHGAADDRGPYLLLEPSDAEDSSSGVQRLYVDQVLELLKKVPNDKLLILDAAQVTADWSLGILHNDFARELEKLDQKIEEIPGLVVINSSGPDEQSWTSEQARKTIFGYYLVEGLKGAAAPQGSLNALQLFNYVHDYVRSWVGEARLMPQEPILLPHQSGRHRAGNMHLAQLDSYQPPEPPATDRDTSTALADLWGKYEFLMEGGRRSSLTPMIQSPHLWHHYQALVLRCEQLLRAGDDEDVARLRTDLLPRAEKAMSSATVQTCIHYALPMRHVFGLAEANVLGDKDKAVLLRDQPPDQAAQVWQALLKKTDQLKARDAATQLHAWLVEKATQDTEHGLSKAHAILNGIDPGGNDRPAELEFLAMLGTHLPPAGRPDGSRLKQALDLRVLAEQVALSTPEAKSAYPYSEQILPWISDRVEKADHLRRLGEDLLFVSDPEAWEKGRREYFEPAQSLYRDAAKDVTFLREAFDLRDRVLSELPWYCQWLALRDDAAAATSVRARLWPRVHQLDAWLQGPKGDSRPGQNQQIKELTQTIRAEFAKTRHAFREECDSMAQIGQKASVTDWHRIESLLSIPCTGTDLEQDFTAFARLKLLELSQSFSQQFNREALEHQASSTRPTAQFPDEQQRTALGLKAGALQGNLALAMLGPALPSRPDIRDDAIDIGKAGVEIAGAWQDMARKIDERTRHSEKSRDIKEAEKQLGEPVQLARHVPGNLALAKLNPVDQDRRLRLHDLLLWEARRTLLDQWWKEDQTKEQPYYRQAGLAFVAAARDLVAGAGLLPDVTEKRLAEVKQLEELLKNDPKQVLESLVDGGWQSQSPHVLVTSEAQFDLRYRLNATTPLAARQEEEHLPAGYCTLWGELNASKPEAKPKGRLELDRALGRKVYLELGLPNPPEEKIPLQNPYGLHLLLEPDNPIRELALPTKETAEFNLTSFYRGRKVDLPTTIDLQPTPDKVVFQRPLPPLAPAGISVLSDQGLGNGAAIALVMDYSRSMENTLPGEGKTRLSKALEAIKRMLKEIPESTYVTVWVLGAENPEDPDAKYDQRSVRCVWKWKPWDRTTDKPQLERRLEKDLKPAGNSPIAHALWRAKESFKNLPPDFGGAKMLLALTDGDDNIFEPGGELNAPGESSRDLPKQDGEKTDHFIRTQFEFSDILVRMLLFHSENDSEKQSARHQFGVLDKIPKGKLYLFDKEDPDELAEDLLDALGIRPSYELRQGEKEGVEPLNVTSTRKGRLETAPREPAIWYWFKPGSYEIRAKSRNEWHKIDIPQPGDKLQLKLTPNGFEHVYQGNLVPPRYRDTREDLLLAAVQNRTLRLTSSREIFCTVEDLRSPATSRDDPLRLCGPVEMWLEFQPQDRNLNIRSWWGNSVGLAARGWQFHCTPAGDRGTLHAWVSRNVSAWKPLPQTKEALAANRELVSVDVSTNERLTVMNAWGEKKKDFPCLVVRIVHDKNNPVLVRVGEVFPPSKGGYEHHYHEEGKMGHYTAVFWLRDGADEARLEEMKSQLKYIPLNLLKEQARQQVKEFQFALDQDLEGIAAPQLDDLKRYER